MDIKNLKSKLHNRKLVLENGKVFTGIGFGSCKEAVAKIIFNNAVVGYQEILSDPSYCNKMVCMTYPLIGNYGMADEDYESKNIRIQAMVVREYNDLPSNFRYTRTLGEVMEENNVVGISDIDTRYLTRILREEGVIKALITDIEKDISECLEIIKNYNELDDLVQLVTSKKIWYSRTPNPMFNVAVIDCGTKLNYIKRLNKEGCNVTCFPYQTCKEEILKHKPSGIFISTGPGDARKLTNVVDTIKSFIGLVPIFAIGLGHQLVALAYGLTVTEMKCGHHGANYAVKNIQTGKVEITSQTHLYTVENEGIDERELKVTHYNLVDNTIEGMVDVSNKVLSVEFEPNNPIDQDSDDLFKQFIEMMRGGANNA